MESTKVSATSAISSVNEIKAKLAKAKRNVSRLERELVRAERLEKEAKEAERAKRIKALLEANKGKRVIIEDNFPDEESCSALAEDIAVIFQNRDWVISCRKEHWGLSMSVVTRVYVEVEI